MKQNAFSFPQLVCRSGVMVLFAIAAAGCAGAPAGVAPDTNAPLEERVLVLLDEWQAAIREQNIERYVRLYREDTIKLIGRPNGVVEILEGVGEIRAEMQQVFAEHGEFLSEHNYPPVEYSYDGLTGMAQLKFGLENPALMEALRFDEREGELKIAEHWVFFRFFPEVEAGDLTGWADDEGNGNGILEPDEQERLFIAAHKVMFEPGGVETPLDEFFDWNNNGKIDEFEKEIAGRELLRNRMRRIDRFDAGFALHRAPPAGQETVWLHDANWISNAVLDSEFFIPVGPAGIFPEGQAELVDFNRDSIISPIEVDIYRDLIIRIAAVNPAPVTYNSRMPAFTGDIRRWADMDFQDGLTGAEYNNAGFELFTVASSPGGSMTWTPLHRFFDRNRDGFLAETETAWARDFMFGFLFPTAVEMGVAVWDWEEEAMVEFSFDFDGNPQISVDEQDSVKGFIIDFRHQFWEKNDPDGTPHRWIDSNEDGKIEMWEGDLFRDKLFQALLTAWLALPHEEADSLMVRSALDEAADLNGDGILSVAERELLIDTLMGPQSAGNRFARAIDFDGDGELTMDEIYRAQDTGLIPVGDELAERGTASLSFAGEETEGVADAVVRSSRSSRPARVKAVSSWGSSLAVLGVRDMTEKMQAAQTDLLVSFLENAFVNFGNVTVVDRQNLEKIMEEYKYQTSALVDEETAVKIGKLSGANAIAMGNLSKLGDTFYLHLKIINVETGAIIGSSISQGLSENDFLGMCNGAVEPLF